MHHYDYYRPHPKMLHLIRVERGAGWGIFLWNGSFMLLIFPNGLVVICWCKRVEYMKELSKW